MIQPAPKFTFISLICLICFLNGFPCFSQNSKKITAPDGPLLHLADSLTNHGDFQAALEVLKKYEQKTRQTDKPEEKIYGLIKLAQAHLSLKQTSESVGYINQSKALLQNSEGAFLKSEILYAQIEYFNQSGNPASAIVHADSAIALKEKFFPDDLINLGKCYQALANTHRNLTYDNRQTEKYLLKTAEVIEKCPDYPPYPKVLCYYFLSAHFMERGKLLAALKYAQQAMEVAKSPKNHQTALLPLCYNLLANAHFYLEEYDLAITYYKHALSLVDPKNVNLAVRFYNNLGINYYNLGDYDNALNYYYKSLKIIEKENPLEKALTFNKIGDIYLDLEKQDSAFFFLESSNRILKKEFPNEKYELASSHNLLGKYYAKKRNDTLSLHHFQQSLVVFIPGLKGKDSGIIPTFKQCEHTNYLEGFLSDKAKFLSQNGSLSKDLSLLKHALSLYRLIDSIYVRKSDFMEIETELHDISHIHQSYGDALNLLNQLYRLEKSDEYLQLAFDYMERVKARILANKLVSLKNADHLSLSDSLMQREASLNGELEEILYAYTENVNETEKQKLDQRFSTIMEQQEDLKRLLAKEFPTYFENRYQEQDMSIATVVDHLIKRNSDLVQFFWTEKFIYVMHFKEGQTTFKALENTSHLQSAINNYRRYLHGDLPSHGFEKTLQAYNQVASGIFQQLLSSFFSEGFPKNLIIIPDGPLSNIPFEALLTDNPVNSDYNFQNLPYLIRKTSISYAYSSRTLFNSYSNQPKAGNLNVLGFAFSDAITMGQSNNQNLPELPGALDEINAMASIFNKGFKGFTGYEATRDNFFNHFQNYGVLHLALHAESDPSIRQNSRIYFRPPESQDNSEYILYAHDLYKYHLNTRLVVLSACETGEGKYYTGEGIYSIARGFSYVGVPSVIMSLWPLGDQSGKKLIPTFYKNLKTGSRLDSALRSAKLDYLKHTDEFLAHPSNWAALVSLGDQSPVILKATSNITWLVISLLTISIFFFIFWKHRKMGPSGN